MDTNFGGLDLSLLFDDALSTPRSHWLWAEESSCGQGTDSKAAGQRPHYIDMSADPTQGLPTQFAVTSKSTVLEVIPAVWT
jgi:hypothetical protein